MECLTSFFSCLAIQPAPKKELFKKVPYPIVNLISQFACSSMTERTNFILLGKTISNKTNLKYFLYYNDLFIKNILEEVGGKAELLQAKNNQLFTTICEVAHSIRNLSSNKFLFSDQNNLLLNRFVNLEQIGCDGTLFPPFPNLTNIDVKICPEATPKSKHFLKRILERESIERLSLENMNTHNTTLRTFASALPKLHTLRLNLCMLPLDGFSNLSPMPLLQELQLSRMNIKPKELHAIAIACPNLERIDLSHSMKWALTEGIAALKLLSNLQKANFSHTYMNDRLLTDFTYSFENLQSIDISYCHQVTADGILALLTNCPSLKRLIGNRDHQVAFRFYFHTQTLGVNCICESPPELLPTTIQPNECTIS